MRDVAFFVSWCIEEYKTLTGLGGASTMELLDKYGVLQYLADNYEVLHTQSWMANMYMSDYNASFVEALRALYKSATYGDLEREDSKLWHYGPVALYEMTHGK